MYTANEMLAPPQGLDPTSTSNFVDLDSFEQPDREDDKMTKCRPLIADSGNDLGAEMSF